jgi:hypothetical protein
VSLPLQRAQLSISIPNTRFGRLARFIAACRGVAGLINSQKAQFKAIFMKGRTEMKALFEKNRATREEMAGLSPKGSGFTTPLQTAKSNAAQGIQRLG